MSLPVLFLLVGVFVAALLAFALAKAARLSTDLERDEELRRSDVTRD